MKIVDIQLTNGALGLACFYRCKRYQLAGGDDMNLKPETLKTGSLPAIWQDCGDLPIYRWHVKRRFRFAPVDLVLISLILGSLITYFVR